MTVKERLFFALLLTAMGAAITGFGIASYHHAHGEFKVLTVVGFGAILGGIAIAIVIVMLDE